MLALTYPNFICRTLSWNSTPIIVAGGNGMGTDQTQLQIVFDIGIDINQNLYVADFQNSRVLRWPIGSTYGTSLTAGALTPSALFVTPNGYIYIGFLDCVKKWLLDRPFTTEGVLVAGGYGNQHGPGTALEKVGEWKGLFVDIEGDVYVSDYYKP
ncbi:unnamed protein product [Didymodactylos carnosus]|uniref:Uncharacterized protein n=1 Tax=Didymodactylos carnosus TaxID=1234261 RepID=A0A816AT54_9BILA|nr:unnamed protein product [Didymodactylos carnosus]CAF4480220.1 unnamed protein product [Didymodactylos carnosus]